MEIIETKLRDLDYGEMPPGFRENTLRRISMLRWRWAWRAGAVTVLANVVISGWHLWSRMTENGLILELRSMISDFSANYYFFVETWHTIQYYLPLWSFGIFALNLALGIYILRIYRRSPRFHTI